MGAYGCVVKTEERCGGCATGLQQGCCCEAMGMGGGSVYAVLSGAIASISWVSCVGVSKSSVVRPHPVVCAVFSILSSVLLLSSVLCPFTASSL
eukprot:912021-Rhodomonas_salina.1